MTIPAFRTGRVQVMGDGVTGSAQIDFVFHDAGDLSVIATDAQGRNTVWTHGDQFTVSGGAFSTGAIHFDPSLLPAGCYLTIALVSDYAQGYAFDGSKLDTAVISNALDKMALSIQAVEARASRSIAVPATQQGDLPVLEVPTSWPKGHVARMGANQRLETVAYDPETLAGHMTSSAGSARAAAQSERNAAADAAGALTARRGAEAAEEKAIAARQDAQKFAEQAESAVGAPARLISVASVGGIGSTNVQAALEVLDQNKAPTTGVAGNWSVGGTISAGGDLILRRSAGNTRVRAISEKGSAFIDADAPSGWSAMFRWLTGGINRWSLHANATPETGDDAGSNLSLSSYHDDGTASATIFGVDRASSVMRVYSELQVPTQTLGDNSLRAANTAYVNAARDAILWVRDERPSGEAGGYADATKVWFARPLQTIEANNIPSASLAENRVTLPAGTYLVHGVAATYATSSTQLRLQDVTHDVTLCEGSAYYARSKEANAGTLCVIGRFVLASAASVEFQQYVNTNADQALGVAVGHGGPETFAEVIFRRIA
ncbi:hypothetical protein C8N35_10176 [Breoghania corrubedonensis]|uniref:Uncharacterized protein n=1 Tax=Breoghania corrubedonensis TaxID=665038 RepID=A0A2T5VE78_9HYPH|nr:hypothetical protein [Breoghania corrubedonensis]PTW62043.1 hypothetical protein C8N35_10176 [Breoghania corrubedonensis]